MGRPPARSAPFPILVAAAVVGACADAPTALAPEPLPTARAASAAAAPRALSLPSPSSEGARAAAVALGALPGPAAQDWPAWLGGSGADAADALGGPLPSGITPPRFLSPVDLPARQYAPAMAVDPSDPSRWFATAEDRRTPGLGARGYPRCGAYQSADAAVTWSDVNGGLAPQATGWNAGGAPALAFDGDGWLHVACPSYVIADNAQPVAWSGALNVATMRRNGAWEVATVTRDDAQRRLVNDRVSIAVDTVALSAHRGRRYLTWTRFEYAPDGRLIRAVIHLSSSDRGGGAWTAPRPIAPGPNPPLGPLEHGSRVIVGEKGQVLVFFTSLDGDTGVLRQMVRSSLDGGATFAPAVEIAPVWEVCPRRNIVGECALPAAEFRVNSFPVAAMDRDGTLHVAWADARTGSAQILRSRSTNLGLDWSEPEPVDPTAADQILPEIAAPSDGTVHLAWYDRRDDPERTRFLPYLVSRPRGATTFAGTPLSIVPIDARPPGLTRFGDYFGLAAGPGRVAAAWAVIRILFPTAYPQLETATATSRSRHWSLLNAQSAAGASASR